MLGGGPGIHHVVVDRLGASLECMYQMSRWSVPSSLRLVSKCARAPALLFAPDLLERMILLRLSFRAAPTMRSLLPSW